MVKDRVWRQKTGGDDERLVVTMKGRLGRN
jgi:hypothetical protein